MEGLLLLEVQVSWSIRGRPTLIYAQCVLFEPHAGRRCPEAPLYLLCRLTCVCLFHCAVDMAC